MTVRAFAAALLLALAAPAARAQTPPPTFPALTAAERAERDRKWARLRERRPEDSSRDIYLFLLDAAARGWRPEEQAGVVDLAEEMHERDPAQKGYGNYRWYWSDAHPDDLNAVQFCMQAGSLAWNLYRDRLGAGARDKLAAALSLAAEGVVRQKVRSDYTNIFLMRAANAVLIGQATGRPGLAAQGKGWLEEWLDYTRRWGVHEFASPTYYGADMESLGALALYAGDAEVRSGAAAALRLFWTDIAADWFEPFQGISGPYSRTYGFLTGHGLLDQQLKRAGWISDDWKGEAKPILDDLTFVPPPGGVRASWGAGPRFVTRRYGPESQQRAWHYVGRSFSLGSAGASYGAQDRMFALTLDGGPQSPVASFSLDYRDDPYGRSAIATGGGHLKLTHLLPLVATAQQGPEVLQAAWFDPARAANPAGGKSPIAYAGVWANLLLPDDVEVRQAGRPLAEGAEVRLDPRQPVVLRRRDFAAAVSIVFSRSDQGGPATWWLRRDGAGFGAMRLSAELASARPRGPVGAALWVRAQEGMNQPAFGRFEAEAASARPQTEEKDGLLALSAPGREGVLSVTLDMKRLRVARCQGSDAGPGILNVNGRDVGGPLLFP